MHVKTYRGQNAKCVMETIKAELGPDAVILESKTVEEDGRRVCVATAAVERQEPAGTAELAEAEGAAPGAAWGDWQAEWRSIKHEFLTLLKPQVCQTPIRPRHRQAIDYLAAEGVAEEITLSLHRHLAQRPEDTVLTPLSRLVTARAWDLSHWPQRFHAVAGPAGVGKTSMALRMALAARRRHPDKTICLVSADPGRSRLSLKHYAQLSGLEYLEVKSAVDTAKLGRCAGAFDGVIIDLPTPERGQSLAELLEESGVGALPDMAAHLCLSPVYGARQIESYLAQYRSPATKSIIWTKLDEACTFGALINAAHATGLPVSSVAFDPGLKDAMIPAESVVLWRLVFKHQLPSDADNEGRQAA